MLPTQLLTTGLLLATSTLAAPLLLEERQEQPQCPDYCSGTTFQNETYVCGDPRLGPVVLPARIPLNVTTVGYDRFGGLCPGAFLATWYNDTGNASTSSYIYPPIGGFFALSTSATAPLSGNMTLTAGTLLDRFGSEYGAYLAPYGSPYEQRSLPPQNLNTPPQDASFPFNYHVYEVRRNLTVLGGVIAPWFGQPGLGTQFQTDRNVLTLVGEGSLRRVAFEELVDGSGAAV